MKKDEAALIEVLDKSIDIGSITVIHKEQIMKVFAKATTSEARSILTQLQEDYEQDAGWK